MCMYGSYTLGHDKARTSVVARVGRSYLGTSLVFDYRYLRPLQVAIPKYRQLFFATWRWPGSHIMID